MTNFQGTEYNPTETYFPSTDKAISELTGHIVFEGIAKQWAENPCFGLVDDAKEQIDWLMSEGFGVLPDELIANLYAKNGA